MTVSGKTEGQQYISCFLSDNDKALVMHFDSKISEICVYIIFIIIYNYLQDKNLL